MWFLFGIIIVLFCFGMKGIRSYNNNRIKSMSPEDRRLYSDYPEDW